MYRENAALKSQVWGSLTLAQCSAEMTLRGGQKLLSVVPFSVINSGGGISRLVLIHVCVNTCIANCGLGLGASDLQ